MTTHTPGPWRHFPFEFGNDENEFVVGHGQYQTIAHVRMGSDDIDGNALANARLISAAPEMLEALDALAQQAVEMRDRLETVFDAENDAIKSAFAAIAKARGTA